MNEPSRGGGIGSIFMLLTLLVGGVALESQVALKSSRPIKKSVIQQHNFDEENIDARLWQDPFEAVLQTIKRGNSTESSSLDFDLKDSDQITILGILVSTGPYFVDAENRRRTRYAVLSGLATSGFQPENAEYIGYLKGGAESNTAKHHPAPEILPYEWFAGERKISGEETIKERVLVLWLGNHHFAHEHGEKKKFLQNIQELFKWVSNQAKKPPQISLIGPTNSTNLQDMLKEIKELTGINKEDRKCSLESSENSSSCLEIYSTRATKNESQLLKLIEADAEIKTIQQMFDEKQGSEIRFLRTTPTDYDLAKAMVRELSFRGIKSDSNIALISEWDTDYGRAFQETICKAWQAFNWGTGKFDEKNLEEPKEKFCDNFKNIHYFSYLRGLDGEIPESDDSSSGKPKKVNPLNSIEEDVDFSSLRAEKERQYDYLLRLAERIEETEKKFGHKPKEMLNPFKTIRFEAFGILGSDYYDKLVVLQALRKRFDHARFFTTDMDARLFQPEDFKHVRNLIVASGFGLNLQDKLQKRIPPFRDTYQTSAYLATLLAFESKECKQSLTQENIDYWLQARVFEIGRTQAFDLSSNLNLNEKPKKTIAADCLKAFTVNANTASSLHPLPAPPIASYKYPAVAILTLSLIFFLCLRFKEHWRWVLAGTLIITLYFIAVCYLSSRWDEEPLAFFEGVSIWPTDFLRLTAVLLAIGVIGYYNGNPFSSLSRGKLEENFDRIRDYFNYSEASAPSKWLPHSKKEFWKKVTWRAAAYVGLALLILGTFGFPFIPFRGSISQCLDIFILILFIISFAISLYYSGVHLNDSIMLLKSFKDKSLKWPEAIKNKIFTTAIPGAVDPVSPDTSALSDPMKSMLNGPVSLRFIGERTDAVDELIYFPLGILTLGVLSRARVFDNWDFPLPLAFLLIYGFMYVLFKALKVQREAKRRKTELLEQMERQRIHFQAQNQETEERFLSSLIENTQNYKKGAFLPLAEHPFNKALLLPFSGFGIMALVEYMFLVV
ncbi:MAG: hypothetical protein OEZ51_14560 [Nitrospinota bacterium]|nr:hypothetical protein [Nitrospinota bacterium]